MTPDPGERLVGLRLATADNRLIRKASQAPGRFRSMLAALSDVA